MLETLTNRSQFGKWLTEHKLTGDAVEIGVLSGGNAKDWISTWPGHLHLVDPWEPQDATIYKEKQDWHFADCYKDCRELAEKFAPRITLHKMLSVSASAKFDDSSLDAVYIDGNHAYEAVMDDLNAWYPKVKKGGILGGHDYWQGTSDGAWCQVKQAVKEWRGAPIQLWREFHRTPSCSSWWFLI
jgi:hypothetical protein